MIKRLKYISRQSRPIEVEELQEIAAASIRNNVATEVTGLLVKIGEYFFQILEGPPQAVDATYERIRKDERHTDIVIVGMAEFVEDRLFADWAMRVEMLDPDAEQRLEPFSHMLQTVVELINKSVEMTAVLQRSLLYEFRRTADGSRQGP